MELVLIKDDLFHVAKRLKEIDARYKLYFNRKIRRFEVYVDGAMQIALPFERLDQRTIEHVRKTRIENLDALMRDIETENARLQKQREEKSIADRLAETERLL